jgi:ribonuclease HII
MDFEDFCIVTNAISHQKKNHKSMRKIDKMKRMREKEESQRLMQIGKSNARLEKESQMHMLHDIERDWVFEQFFNPMSFEDYGFHDGYSSQRDFAEIRDCGRNWELFYKRNQFSTEPQVITYNHRKQFDKHAKKVGLFSFGGNVNLLHDNFDYKRASEKKRNFYEQYI